jgi:hypothetical protein
MNDLIIRGAWKPLVAKQSVVTKPLDVNQQAVAEIARRG